MERWILAALRHERFTSLGELNERIGELIQRLNEKPFRKRPESRASLFRTLDQPALRALPAQRYEHAEWLAARVHPDYHVQVCKHFYSVPCELVQEKLDVRLTLDGSGAVPTRDGGWRRTPRSRQRSVGCTTLEAHQPRAHREQAKWTPERMKSPGCRQGGPGLGRLACEILERSEYPRERYREVNGLIRLADQYGVERMERGRAAGAALRHGQLPGREGDPGVGSGPAGAGGRRGGRPGRGARERARAGILRGSRGRPGREAAC